MSRKLPLNRLCHNCVQAEARLCGVCAAAAMDHVTATPQQLEAAAEAAAKAARETDLTDLGDCDWPAVVRAVLEAVSK